MAFRNVIIVSRCKLDYSLNYLVIHKGVDVKKILLDEIRVICLNTTQVSITTALISECLKKKIKIILSDEKHNPVGEITPYYNNYYAYRKLKEQINFSDDVKDYLWQQLIKNKIYNQYLNLKEASLEECNILAKYIDEVTLGDNLNREGIAAKVYFKSLFGPGFNRDLVCPENIFLDYGYSIILSSINRLVKMYGYYTEIGIHHIGESNSFNLSCDLMEPLRPLVDRYVINGYVNLDNYKEEYVKMLELKVKYDDKTTFLDNALEEYVEDILAYLKTKDKTKIKFIEYEL